MTRRGLVALIALSIVSLSNIEAMATGVAQPNFVFVLTDDQAIHTLRKMPNVQALRAEGTTFLSAIISNPLCCPSRASILTGLYSHNSGVYTNGGDDGYGGYPAFRDHGNLTRTFVYELDGAGYNTGLYGKYLNQYDGSPQPGWDEFHSFAGSNGGYYDYGWIDNGVPTHYGSGPPDYSTNVAGRKARAFLNAQDGSAPFFLYYAPYGPHGPITPGPGDADITAPNSFATPAFNEEDMSDKPPYLQGRGLYDPAKLAANWDDTFGTLASIDRWLGRFSTVLANKGMLDNTYFIFLSDNGYTWGDHRWKFKVVPYERSIHVPFVMSGPGVRHQNTGALVTNVDLASTILDLAGVPPLPSDGQSLEPLLTGTGGLTRTGILLEHKSYPSKNYVPTYCGIRTAGWMFARYEDGFEELYDLTRDPYELNNVAGRHSDKVDSLRQSTYDLGCDSSLVPPPR